MSFFNHYNNRLSTTEWNQIMNRTYSENYLASAFEIDRQTANRCLRDVAADLEQTKGRPTYKISTFARALEQHHLRNASNNNDGAAGSEAGSDKGSLTAARIRVTNANALAKEHANEILLGKYTDNETALHCFMLAISTMREIMLSMPGKLADRLATHSDKDRSSIFEILRVEIYDALTLMSTPQSYVDAGIQFAKLAGKSLPTPTSDGHGGNSNER
jgi:hypothetical protein